MANTSCANLCILVFLVSVSLSLACPDGKPHGKHCDKASSEHDAIEFRIQFQNQKNLNMSFQNYVRLENNTRVAEPQVFLPDGAWDYALPPDSLNVFTGFVVYNDTGYYYQDIITWSQLGKTPYVPCTSTNCVWKVDETGFTVVQGNLLEFIAPWFGPIHITPPFVSRKGSAAT